MLYKLLSQVPYLGSKAGPLGGQGSNLSLVRFRRLSGALGKAGPPCQTFHISSHLLKNKKESVNKTEKIKKRIGEGAWTYKSGSLKQKSQSLLNG